MAIIIDEQKKLFTLQTKSSTYQMKADKYGTLLHTYYGAKITPFDMSYLIVNGDHGFSGNPYRAGNERTYSLDTLPQEYSCYGSGDFRPSALKIRRADGSASTELVYDSCRLQDGKYSLEGLPALYMNEGEEAQTLIITLKDESDTVRVHLYYGVMEEADIITRAAVIENTGDQPFHLERAMSLNLDFLSGSYDFITFHGKHAMERQMTRNPIHPGILSAGSTRGASSHHYNPFLILAGHNTTEDHGECYGFSFLYSGDFLGEAEYDQMDQTRLVLGIHPGNFNYKVAPGQSFTAPEAALAYSCKGLSALSHVYHAAYRNNLCRGRHKKSRRPILINNWEGTYFDFNGDKLVAMAKEASELGVELFVMDDGWFGNRNDDNTGLGDWTVNEKKLGCTLKELSDRIHETGMMFGIWFEPECISEDSSLYRTHPDWAFKVPGKSPVRSRYQLVLDFSREDVREHIYSQICTVLDSARIEYVKWDFNRSISDIYSAALPADRQGETAHRYVLGLYEMLEKLTSRYPAILFEGCSGGGGRFDAGMLYYTPQIWCSDDTDAIERLKIQYGTSFGYPVSTVGSHVSAVPNHQTGRVTPLSTRAVVAMSGTFGYELDVNKMTDAEKSSIKDQIQDFKKYYFLIQDGLYYRLTDPFTDERYCAWEFAEADGRTALVNVVNTRTSPNPSTVYIRLKGLIGSALYRINGSQEQYPGSALMSGGIALPVPAVEYESWQFFLTAD